MFRSLGDLPANVVYRTAVLISGVSVLMVIAFLVKEAAPGISQQGITAFLGGDGWQPSANRFNLLPMLAGSAMAALGAVLMSIPIGIGVSVFRHYYAPRWLSRILGRVIELLGGVPSVILGFWGLVVIVPRIAQWHAPGASLLAAILVLALMIVPTIALTAYGAIESVPESVKEGALALGSERWLMLCDVILPAARPAILTGILLAMGRALGETMAVMMVAGNIPQIPENIFQPVRTLTANIALEMSYATDEHRAALFVGALALTMATASLLFVADYIGHNRSLRVAT